MVAGAACAALVLTLASDDVEARRSGGYSHRHLRHVVRAPPVLPFEFPNAQYVPVAWGDVAGWRDDDQLAAFNAFRNSCAAIIANPASAETKTLGRSLVEPCREARRHHPATTEAARAFFEAHFVPLRISKLGDVQGFVTGYYEPEVEGSPTRTDVYTVPIYRRPSNLFVRGYSQSSTNLPNKGQVFRKIGRRKLVPYYDRGEIEDGAIAGRGLELCWLKDQTDLLFIQIQGSARVRMPDGSVTRLNYDAHNGYPYTPVGRVLIDRNIIPREQMSMQRIRQWMEENPDGAKDLRRQNRSYVFFRKVDLAADAEAVGAQGVHLMAGRSIAVDKALHVYGTPFFISGALPLESEQSPSAFHRLMVAQDTGSAIVGPARADIYFGAGQEAGRVAGRLKNGADFTMLVPKSMDPRAGEHTVWLPEPRPAAAIARFDVGKTDSAGPDLTKSDVTKSDVTKSDVGKPAVAGTDVTKTEVTKTDVTRAVAGKSDVARPKAAVSGSPGANPPAATNSAATLVAEVPLPAPRPDALKLDPSSPDFIGPIRPQRRPSPDRRPRQ
ncbi:murein transglycosylase A [Bradyrhizobium sp. WD16]|uniref:murein transglycosylase A n=1 Tax=Bradyrhizobium sp. WD16 TaxID=1521768 RepID=UPI0020A23B47|nr:murein transglycosylase A [Bradyrhizobium sp. WD16]